MADKVKSFNESNYRSVNYTARLVQEIMPEFLGIDPKSSREFKIQSVIALKMNSLEKHARKIRNKKSSAGSPKFFVDMMRDINELLSFIRANIDLILTRVIEIKFSAKTLIIDERKCRSFDDNDMRIYCYALVYSSEQSKSIFLITKDRDFKNKVQTWKHAIVNELHLKSYSVEIIRM